VLTCEKAREATSAQLDGADPAVPLSDLRGHLDACGACREWRSAAAAATRRARLTATDGVPDRAEDIAAAVLAADDPVPSPGRRRARIGLAVIAAAQLAVTIPVLVLGHDHSTPMHVAHELGSFDLALAVGFLVAVFRPARAAGMAPLVGVAAVALVATAGIDLAAGRTQVSEEAPHLLAVAGCVLLWLIARGESGHGSAPARHKRNPATASPGRLRGRAAAALLIIGAGSAVAVGAVSRPAGAHAVLESTSPADGSIVRTAPQAVALRFGEPVIVPPGAVRAYDDRLRRVDQGAVDHPDGRADSVGVSLRPALPPGTYTVTWRVISADSHPVSGGFTFSVGHSSAVAGTAVSSGGGSTTVGVLLGATRLAGFVGIVLGLGSAVVLFALWPAGRRVRRARVLVWTGWGLLVAGSAGGLLLQGPYGAGAGLGQLFDSRLLSTTIETRFGTASMTRITLLLMLAALLGLAFSQRPVTVSAGAPAGPAQRQPPRWLLGAGLAVSVAILVTFAVSGHAADDTLSGLTLTSDVVHLAAIAVWIGGLALLVDCLAVRSRAADLAVVLPRYSRLAFTAVVLIATTGVFQSWREVGSWPALVDTVYGRLLLAKMGGFLVLVGLGNLARRWVRRHYLDTNPLRWFAPRLVAHADGPVPPVVDPPPATRRADPAGIPLAGLRRGLVGEVVIGLAVLVLSTILVNTAQAKETYAPHFQTTVAAAQTRLQVTVDPARTGMAMIQLRADTPSGRRQPIQQVTGALSLPAHHVGPVPVHFTRSAPGQAMAMTSFAVSGRWDLDVSVQTSAFDATTFRVAIPVQ
jgi:copper transport protein